MSPLWGSNSKADSIYKHSVLTGLSIIEYERHCQEEICFSDYEPPSITLTTSTRARIGTSEVLGVQPYFDEPFYVGFNVAGYELGLQPGAATSDDKADGAVAYWGVDDAATELQRILELGATIHEALQDVGQGIKVATVKDPFGNIFGIIENPNFKLQ